MSWNEDWDGCQQSQITIGSPFGAVGEKAIPWANVNEYDWHDKKAVIFYRNLQDAST